MTECYKLIKRLLQCYDRLYNREFSHGGSIESASAHISHRIDNGLTVSVMSDMTGLERASKLAEMIQQRLLEDNS